MAPRIGLSKLLDYEGYGAKILYFMDLRAPRKNYKESHYYYYTLFQIDRGSYQHYKVVEVPVEYAVLFPLNTYYSILPGGRLSVESSPREEIVRINIPFIQEIKRLKEVVSPEHFNHSFISKKDNELIDFTDRIGNQFIFVGDSEWGKVIVPCNLIASAFYFTSTRIVRYIFENDLSKTFKKIEEKGDRFIYYAKPGFSDADVPRVIHFVVNNYAREKVYKLSQKLRKSQIDEDISRYIPSTENEYTHVYAEFPFYGEYEFKVHFHQMDDYMFIDHIIQHGQLPYDTYKIEIVREKVEYTNTDNEEIVAKIDDPSKVTDVLTLEHPNKSIKGINYRILYEQALLDNKIKKRIIKVQKEGKNVVFEEGEIDEVEAVSTEPATKTTDKKVAKANIQRVRRTSLRDTYDLEDFMRLLERLEPILGVRIQKLEEDELPEIKDKRQNKCNKLEYYNADCSARRRYLYAYFVYNGKHILLVEIDQLQLNPGVSTFVLIANKPFRNEKAMAELMLRRHLKKIKKEQIQKEFMQHFGIYVYYKKHPSKKEDELEESWCRGIAKVVSR